MKNMWKSAGFVVVLKNLNREVFSLRLSFKINKMTPAWKRKNGVSSVIILPKQHGSTGKGTVSPWSLLPPGSWWHNAPGPTITPGVRRGEKKGQVLCTFVCLTTTGLVGCFSESCLFNWLLHTYGTAFSLFFFFWRVRQKQTFHSVNYHGFFLRCTIEWWQGGSKRRVLFINISGNIFKIKDAKGGAGSQPRPDGWDVYSGGRREHPPTGTFKDIQGQVETFWLSSPSALDSRGHGVWLAGKLIWAPVGFKYNPVCSFRDERWPDWI